MKPSTIMPAAVRDWATIQIPYQLEHCDLTPDDLEQMICEAHQAIGVLLGALDVLQRHQRAA